MKVLTHIGGSTCVIQMREDGEEYIDARNDARYPDHVYIEHVRAGQVRYRDLVLRKDAPVTMLQLAKRSNP